MGEELSLIWTLPFAGMLLSIGFGPLFAPHFWHHHFGKISFGWAALLAVPFVMVYGYEAVVDIVHIYALDYVPFVILVGSLFVVSGGILISGTLVGRPITNTLIILVGTALASWIGTTGASMLLIRPLLRANESRRYKIHTIVFFIFLVSNIGGALTPLGDPPLFLGFLHKVPFFWTLTNLFSPLLVASATLLVMYFAIDTFWYRKEPAEAKMAPRDPKPLRIAGKQNFILLGAILGGVLLSGYWKPTHIDLDYGALEVHDGELVILDPVEHHDEEHHGGEAEEHHGEGNTADHEFQAKDESGKPHGETKAEPTKNQDAEGEAETELSGMQVASVIPAQPLDSATAELELHGVEVPIQNIARDLILVTAAILSLLLTSKELRQANGFTWFPINEVAILFAGIFMTIVPALEILAAGKNGALAPLIANVQTPANYFWVTGVLSSFLDNAPTYLTFFNTALGRFYPGMSEGSAVPLLISEHNDFLLGIAMGAVFMGANTYIGNAPNFMVKSIAEEAGIKMPDFFSYIGKYSLPLLVPIFVLMTFLFLM
ncbi:Citrate transporter [Planctomycetes bacterium Pan216]|uniref:Citrate transporter n=1 Tax=Kolteria novifilia TaxID=2527975 RepID=A0A518B1N8_9BACT|nr:Citrate transporter [Planctomycetes bacterium Pan216]